MNPREQFAGVLEELCTVYDIELRPGRAELYWADLKQFSASVIEQAARDLRTTCKRFPTLAEWVERCKAICAQRARAAAPTTRESAEPVVPTTWIATANLVLTFAALAGVKTGDSAARARALEIVNDELRAGLREEFNTPTDVPPARRIDERRRIVRVLVRELAGEAAVEPS